jgi:magnesium chelatase family protein
LQQARFHRHRAITCNARMESREVRRHCAPDASILEYLKHAMQDLGLSARAYDRILKVSRTIADLSGSDDLTADHVMEAVQLRSLDRQIWG